MYDLMLPVIEGLLSSEASFPCCSVMYPQPGHDTELRGQRFPLPDLTLLSGTLANVTRARFKTCLPVWIFPFVLLNHITIERTCLKKPRPFNGSPQRDMWNRVDLTNTQT